MIVMSDRECGEVQDGGYYGVGLSGPGGTLKMWTWLPAPLPAEIANPRAMQTIGVTPTLTGQGGLCGPTGDDTSFAGLPTIGVADLWGKARGYKTPWLVAEETMRLHGISRRIPKPPDLPLPILVLVMHGDAVINLGKGTLTDALLWIGKALAVDVFSPNWADLDTQPWREAESLAMAKDDNYAWHPYVLLWQFQEELRQKKLWGKFVKAFDVTTEQGVFALTWINAIVKVVGVDQEPDEVLTEEDVRKGVQPAYHHDDPRADGAEPGMVDDWDEDFDWDQVEHDDHPGNADYGFDTSIEPEHDPCGERNWEAKGAEIRAAGERFLGGEDWASYHREYSSHAEPDEEADDPDLEHDDSLTGMPEWDKEE